ncbi:MAG: C_GCAxxG_C_C family protein [Thermoguttaceae bacterium]|nr:C_GCAxxG_C_C family protein [Thermoguttaceae bacterium]MBQ6619796.1 C_GCAxxG_C_C family protein [Thermoguttaceae bacterium]
MSDTTPNGAANSNSDIDAILRLPRAQKAKAFFEQGYNCAQSVLLAFGDKTGLADADAARFASSFGGGIGRLREVCGAFSGMCMALGMISGCADPADAEGKKAQYQVIQNLAGQFRDANGSIVCRELLGLTQKCSEPTPEKRTEGYYRKRPCGDLVAFAAGLLDRELAR